MDAVDTFIDQWRQVRPELDAALWPVEIVGRVQRLSRLLDRELKAYWSQYGLEPFEVDVLTTLRRAGGDDGLTPGALIALSMVTSGAITNRIDRMEAKGLVTRVRDGADRRSVRIALTGRGRELIDETMAGHLANGARLLAALDAQQVDEVAAGLRTLLEAHGDTAD